MYQEASLPAPLPILTPLAFLDSGKCGKIETQKALLVQSAFRAERFKKSFNRKIFFAEIRNGLRSTKPTVPYDICVSVNLVVVRPFCLLLYLNLRGCNIIFTLLGLLLGYYKAKVKIKQLIEVSRLHNKNQKL